MNEVPLRNKIKYVVTIFSLALSLSVHAVNISFDGELVEFPCQIDTSSDGQNVVFLDRPVKDFHIFPGVGPAEKFNIRLINCRSGSAWKTVKLKFTGDKELAMKDKSDYFIQVSGSGNKGKLAVGIIDIDGKKPLKLGETHNNTYGTPLADGSINLEFRAFIQATPEAIENKSVQPGPYTAIARFELSYE